MNPSTPLLRSPPRIAPLLGMGAGVVAVSTASILVRYAQLDGAPSLAISALRLVIASLVLLPLAWTRSRDELMKLTRRDLGIGLLSGTFLGAHFATWITSLQYTTVSSSVVLVTLSPLFVALGSALILKEKLSTLTLLGMSIAVAGGIITGAGDSAQSTASAPLLGNLLALAGALSIAPHFLIGRHLRKKLSLLAYISLVYSAAALVLLLVVGATGTPLVGFDPQAYVWMSLLALVPQLLGHTSFNWSLGYFPAAFATIPALGEPVGSTILAILILHEVVTPLKLLGGVLILGGIAFMTISRMRQGKAG